MGRHSTYTPEIAERICNELATGRTLREICRTEPDFPAAPTVVLWANTNPVFAEQYARARQAGLDVIAEEIIEISDDASNDWMERKRDDGSTQLVVDQENIQRSRLRVDSRKWLLSKMAPKKYGDRLELAGDKDNPLVPHKITIELVKAKEQLREGEEK